MIGEYLFTDSEFINRLSTEKPTLFKKIFDEIKYLYKTATAGSKEARQLEKVKKTFEEAYRQKNNTATDDGVRYAINKKSLENVNDLEYNNDTHYGETLIHTPEQLKPTTDREWQTFCRSFANKTNGLSDGEHKDITIFTADYQYLVGADGYMKGTIFSKISIDEYNERKDFYDSYSRTEIFDSENEGNGNRQGDNSNSILTLEDKGTDTFDVELDKFIRNHPEYFKNTQQGHSNINREQKLTPNNTDPITKESSTDGSFFDASKKDTKTSNSAEDVKKKQLEIINKHNPAPNTYNTWVRSVDDIKTFEEALADDEIAEYDEFNPDFDRAMAEQAIKDGEITVYSSYPIKQGVFVSPSYMEAESYSGDGTVYSKRVPLDSVAWIDITQGQYADTKTDEKKLSLSNTNDDIAPVRERNNVYGEDIKLEPASAEDIAPTAEDIKNQNTLVIDDAPIKDASSTHNDLVNQMSDIMDENYISLEEFTNSNSSVWKNVDYNDKKTKTKIMREVHQNMVNDGVVVEIADDVKETVAKSYPDLRSMKKKDRTPIIKEAINKLKSNLRSFLSDFKNQSFEFEVSGKVLEAKLSNTGINEVLEKITKDKAEMLYSTREIFRNARYLYSTPDYDGDPNVYRWNYFYTPVKIGDDTVGVRIAVRDTATPQESQIYNWGIKKDTSLDGVGRGTNDRISHDVSSNVSTDIIPNDEQNVNENTPDYFLDSEDKQETKLTRKGLHEDIIAGIWLHK